MDVAPTAAVPSVAVFLFVVAVIIKLRLNNDQIGTLQRALSLLKKPNAQA